MELNVLGRDSQGNPWYSKGLVFTCTQCGNCCTGGPGYVWISDDEIARLAEHLSTTPEEISERYCRKIGGRFSLKERRTPEGLYDCVFLKEDKSLPSPAGVTTVRKVCSVYSARPLQCRTWPFWPENISSVENWKNAGERCEGIEFGTRKFTQQQIEAVRDSADWPKDPPGSVNPT